MNQAGAARLLAVVVLVAQAAQHLVGTRPGADSASSPQWARRGPPAGLSAQGRRDRDGDAGINQRLGAFAGPVGVFAEVGLYVEWTSTVRIGRRHQQPRVL